MKELKYQLKSCEYKLKVANNTDLSKLKYALTPRGSGPANVVKEEFTNELQLIECSGFYNYTVLRFKFGLVNMPTQYIVPIECFLYREDALKLIDLFEKYKKQLEKTIADIKETQASYEKTTASLIQTRGRIYENNR